MGNLFQQPSQPGQFALKDYLGRLVLFTVHAHEADIQTAFGVSDAIRADVVVLDGADAPEEIADALIFGRAVVGSLKGNVGQQVLARIGQGTARPGQSAPWVLNAYSDTDAQVATDYVTRKAAGGMKQPGPSGPTAVPSPAAADSPEAKLLAAGYDQAKIDGLKANGTDLAAVAALVAA